MSSTFPVLDLSTVLLNDSSMKVKVVNLILVGLPSRTTPLFRYVFNVCLNSSQTRLCYNTLSVSLLPSFSSYFFPTSLPPSFLSSLFLSSNTNIQSISPAKKL